MITTPTWLSIPTAGGTASISTTGLNMSSLYLPNTLLPAEHLNYFLNGFSNNSNVSETALQNVLLEMQNLVTGIGFTLDPTDNTQLEKADIARKHTVGELVWFETAQTPVIYSAAKSTTNPGNPAYNPLIARWDADHDITSAQAPDLVTAYRGEFAKINVSGSPINSWTGTVSGSTITFASNGNNLALLNLIVNEGNANGYIATQNVSAGAVFTGTAQRCVTVNGTEYPIAGASVGGLTITVTGTPTTGSQTLQLPTYRIAGSSTSIRLPRLSGMAGLVAYDYDGVYVSGWRRLDTMQGHWHSVLSVTTATGGGPNMSQGGGTPTSNQFIASPITDGTNGTPRSNSKNTNPWAIGLLAYTWASRLLA